MDSVEVVSSDFSALPRHLIYRSQQPVSGLPEEFDWREAFARMKLVPEIHDSAASYYLSHLADGPFVGVSVRANKFAHQKTLEASPVEWYIARMRELVAINPDLSFFLSCDDPSAQKYISDSVPRVFSLEKTGRYNSVEGVKEAVIDLYILSLASHILGPHWSSFVELSLACASSRTTFETSQQPPESVTLYPLPNKPLWWRG
ncbi:O-fucosyltransferase family protein [Gordonia amicalis]|uniref:Uncharacterized protein n=1 Tax=Gordonia amicalis TaxID=89053 RepID=A0ABU4DJP5_9ACTN|nr:hypothetical protein [Gordonia amicalis]MDV6309973.1 hypothetical protein [Gordonia amicalis]